MSYIDPDQLHGALDGFITFVSDNAETLTAKGVDPEKVKANLTGIRDDLSAKKQERDNRKTSLAEAQQTFAASAATNYVAFSDEVDAVAGALGKRTPAGEQALNYRKRVTGGNHRASPQPAPTPSPAN